MLSFDIVVNGESDAREKWVRDPHEEQRTPRANGVTLCCRLTALSFDSILFFVEGTMSEGMSEARDTFAAGEETTTLLLAQSVRLMQLAALVRAVRVSHLAARRLERAGRGAWGREQRIDALEREYLHSLEVVRDAADAFIGVEEEENRNG
jgi:hypothetical protein